MIAYFEGGSADKGSVEMDGLIPVFRVYKPMALDVSHDGRAFTPDTMPTADIETYLLQRRYMYDDLYLHVYVFQEGE